MIEALKNSGGNCHRSRSRHLERQSVRDVGRTLASIGDNLNEEALTRRSTIIFFLQMGDLGGVLMSFLVPSSQFSFHHGESEMSFFVLIIRFHAGISFTQVQDG